MKSSSTRVSGWKSLHEWISAFGTLLVLFSVYVSMDKFSSYAPQEEKVKTQQSTSSLSVAPPYWNTTHGYGFRSIAWDVYEASSSNIKDVVSVKNSNTTAPDTTEVKVSYYKDSSIESIEKNIPPDTPRAYSKLSRGIAVIEWNLDSARAKIIFSTLHSE